ncbi:MAG: hypothetical protein K0R34_2474 [Herbinix sp.]|nr:hypothetical protein [Herbinix sp.]
MKKDIKTLLKFILGFIAVLALFGTMGSLECSSITFGQALIQAGAIGAGLIIGSIVSVIREIRVEKNGFEWKGGNE